MSLVNDMLRNLDARQRLSGDPMGTVVVRRRDNPLLRGVLMGLGAALVLAAAVLTGWWWRGSGETLAGPVARVAESPVAAPEAIPEPVIEARQEPAPEEARAVGRMAVDPEPRADEARPLDPPRAAIVTEALTSEAPVNPGSGQEEDASPASTSRSEVAVVGIGVDASLVVPEAEPAVTPERLIEEARALAAQGRSQQAVARYRAALEAGAPERSTREALADVLYRSGDARGGDRVLARGAEAGVDRHYFRRRWAQALVRRGRVRNAVAVLAEDPPDIAREPRYHAFTAALWQQLDACRQAADIYARLVTLDEAEADWFAGLGLCLDRLGDREAAIGHYRAALEKPGLAAALERHARRRLAVLEP